MNIEHIMRLADAYARAVWGESDEQHEARAALEAALTEKQEPTRSEKMREAGFTRRLKGFDRNEDRGAEKQEPVAWMSRTGHGTYFRESLSPELEALEFGGNKMWTPLYTANQLAGAVLRERERCAKVCEHIGNYDENVDEYYSDVYAAAIRSGE